MAYATLSDYEARYGAVGPDREVYVTTMLGDAGSMLDALVPRIDPSDSNQADLLRMVSCAMVNRAVLASEADSVGVSQYSFGMGPFSQSATVANPSGDMYLTAQERRLLGVGGVAIGSIPARIGPPEVPTC